MEERVRVAEEAVEGYLETPLELYTATRFRRADQAFALVRQASFDPDASWSLFIHEQSWHVRRVVAPAMRTEQDDIYYRYLYVSDAPVPETDATGLVAELTDMHLAPFLPMNRRLGLDGCDYTIYAGSLFLWTRFHWWGDVPEPWTALRDWYAKSVSLFEAHLPDCSVPIQDKHPWVT